MSGDGAGYTYEIDIHDTPTETAVCTRITNPAGQNVFSRDVVVPKDLDPQDLVPPFNPATVDTDAPDGEGATSPCAPANGGTGTGTGSESTRGYARTGTNAEGETVICTGFRSPVAQRHVRVTVH